MPDVVFYPPRRWSRWERFRGWWALHVYPRRWPRGWVEMGYTTDDEVR